MLDAMGVLGAVESAGAAQLTGMLVRAPNGYAIEGAFVAKHGFRGFRDRGLALRREVLDQLLLHRARDLGTRVIEGARVESVERSTRGYLVSLRVNGTVRQIQTAMLIGADGLRSVVARQLGLARRRRWPRRLALVAHWRGVQGIGSRGEMHVQHDGYVGLADVGDGVTNVALVVPTSLAKDVQGASDESCCAGLRDTRICTLALPARRVYRRCAPQVHSVQTHGAPTRPMRRSWAMRGFLRSIHGWGSMPQCAVGKCSRHTFWSRCVHRPRAAHCVPCVRMTPNVIAHSAASGAWSDSSERPSRFLRS